MGFLKWRGWDRLDELDRRVGIRRDPVPLPEQVRRLRRQRSVSAGLELVAAFVAFLTAGWEVMVFGVALTVIMWALLGWWANRLERRAQV